MSGEKSYTAAGNLQPPDTTLCLKWVKEAWKSVSIDVIKKSLVACGISSSLDGSQDTEISCIKVGGIAAEAAATISAQTQELLVSADEEQDDPFANCEEDEDKLEENALYIHEFFFLPDNLIQQGTSSPCTRGDRRLLSVTIHFPSP